MLTPAADRERKAVQNHFLLNQGSLPQGPLAKSALSQAFFTDVFDAVIVLVLG